jgi:hypothetical protein
LLGVAIVLVTSFGRVGLVALRGRDRENKCCLGRSGILATGAYIGVSSCRLFPEDDVVNVFDKGCGWWPLSPKRLVGGGFEVGVVETVGAVEVLVVKGLSWGAGGGTN